MALTPKQTEELRGKVQRRRSQLLAELREDAARARDQPYSEHAGIAPDTGDESVATLIADLEQADVTRDLDELRAMEAAWQRLKAFPAAARCVTCQERHEKTYGGAPKPSL